MQIEETAYFLFYMRAISFVVSFDLIELISHVYILLSDNNKCSSIRYPREMVLYLLLLKASNSNNNPDNLFQS